MDLYTLGIDVGSTASKCVILKNGTDLVAKSLVDVGAGTSGSCPSACRRARSVSRIYPCTDCPASAAAARIEREADAFARSIAAYPLFQKN